MVSNNAIMIIEYFQTNKKDYPFVSKKELHKNKV